MSKSVHQRAPKVRRKFSPAVFDTLESRQLLAAVKIMALGDSITAGWSGHDSYRYRLYSSLAQAGYDVNFVGTRNTIGSGTAPHANSFDPDNEGHAGWMADQIQSSIAGWANTYKPDIVLLHIGTNDISVSQAASGIIAEVGGIIDNLRSVVPNVKILLAKIIPASGFVTQTNSFNNLIPNLISSKTSAQSPITMVDQYSGFNANSDNFDGIHPNEGGEVKMAAKWYSALQSILPAPPALPAGTYLSDLTPSSNSNGWGSYEKDRSNGENSSGDGSTILLNGTAYRKGLGVHASSDITYNITGGNYTNFVASLGVDDEVGSAGSVVFQVYINNSLKYTSPTLTGNSAAVPIDIAVPAGSTSLRLVVSDAGNGNASDHADWAMARLIQGVITPAPTAPSGLSADLSGSQINLSWTDASNNETGFRVERKTGANGTYAQIAELAAGSTSYSDTTVAVGNTYFYRVYAYNGGGNSGFSNEANAAVPVPPGLVYVSDLNWSSMTNGWGNAEKDRSNGENGSADGKTITLNGVTYTKGIGIHAASDITYALNGNYLQFLSDIGVDDEVGSGGSVQFQIYLDNVLTYTSPVMTGSSATQQVNLTNLFGKQTLRLVVNDSGNGNTLDHADWANARLIAGTPVPPPSAPTGLSADAGTNKINLSWTDASTDETGFRVERKTGVNGTYAQIADLAAGSTSYSDTTAVAGIKYYYRVYAYNTGGNSSYSSDANATIPLPPPPAAPSGLGAVLNGGQINLSWTDASSDEAGFRIERKTGGNGTYAQIADLTAGTQTYSDANILGGNTYYYRVYAYNAGGSSAFTDEASAAVPVPPQVYLSDLNWSSMTNGWGDAEKNRSNGENGSADGATITLNGVTYTKGIGVHAASDITFALNGNYVQFLSDIGVDDEVGNSGSVKFQVYLDGVLTYTSPVMTGSSATQQVNLTNLAGKQTLRLVVTDNGNGNAFDHADWANARLITGTPVAPPSAPTTLAAEISGNQVNLAWTDASSDETGFRVQRKLGAAGAWGDVQTLAANATGWADSLATLQGSSTYFYRVIAFNAGGDSPASNESSITTPIVQTTTTYLSNLSPTSATNGWGTFEKDRSNGEQGSADGKTITLNGMTYTKGIGVHAASDITYNIAGGNYVSFSADIGVDDEIASGGSVVFQVYVDGVLKFTSGVMTGSTATASINLSLSNASTLRLVVTDAGDGANQDHADWANARLTANVTP
jgi:fibronectin type 3 domain-containing protein/lysophospholipase L1-like esterase